MIFKSENIMLIKIILLTFSYSLLLFVDNSFQPAYAADCEAHLSMPWSYRAKEMFIKKRAMKRLEKLGELSQKKGTLENTNQ